MMQHPLTTNVYIDGFNLYYRASKPSGLKWIDLRQLSQLLFPDDNIQDIHYFTAHLSHRPGNEAQRQRQQTYLRALRTIPDLEIHLGYFTSQRRIMPLADTTPIQYAPVLHSEEKGSDVNLAVQLVFDGFVGQYDHAVVISNDADFAGAMSLIKDNLNLKVSLVNPDPKQESPRRLSDAANFVKRVRRNHLLGSQLPDRLSDQNGEIVKPAGW